MRLTSIALLFTAGLACGPGKDDTESTGDTGTTAAASTGGDTTAPTTSGGDPSGTGTGTGSETTASTGEPATSVATTGPGDGCDSLLQKEQCDQDPACMSVVGKAFDFAGCMPGETFLACMPAMACDAVLIDICKDPPGDEQYELSSGCIPPGFFSCVPGDLPLCGASECETLPEQGCLAAPDCTQITGAPHIDKGGQVCVDFGEQQFLGCVTGDVACPPVVLSVCPEGQPDMVFDVASGCIPPGFVMCDMTAPDCQ